MSLVSKNLIFLIFAIALFDFNVVNAKTQVDHSKFQSWASSLDYEKLKKAADELRVRVDYATNRTLMINQYILGVKPEQNFSEAKLYFEGLVEVQEKVQSFIMKYELNGNCSLYYDTDTLLYRNIIDSIETILTGTSERDVVVARSKLEFLIISAEKQFQIFSQQKEGGLGPLGGGPYSCLCSDRQSIASIISKRAQILSVLKTTILGKRGVWDVLKRSTELAKFYSRDLKEAQKTTFEVTGIAIASLFAWELVFAEGLGSLVNLGLISSRAAKISEIAVAIGFLSFSLYSFDVIDRFEEIAFEKPKAITNDEWRAQIFENQKVAIDIGSTENVGVLYYLMHEYEMEHHKRMVKNHPKKVLDPFVFDKLYKKWPEPDTAHKALQDRLEMVNTLIASKAPKPICL